MTGDVEYMEYFGMTIVPLYFDQGQVKDLPLKGESFWFTGTLIGYQYGATGITRGVGVGGDPYILLRSVSGQPPEGPTYAHAKEKKRRPALLVAPCSARRLCSVDSLESTTPSYYPSLYVEYEALLKALNTVFLTILLREGESS